MPRLKTPTPPRLLEMRLNAGLTIEDLAKQADVSDDVVQKGHQRRPRPREAKMIADVFRVRVTDIWPLS